MSNSKGRDMPRTFLVTGGAGFIGSHLSEALVARGDKVVALDDLSTGRLDNLKRLRENSNFRFVESDMRNLMVLDRLVSEADVVIHLAAAVGVSLVLDKPVSGMRTNIGATEDVLETSHRYGVPIYIASTSEVYGKGASVPFSEGDDVLLGNVSYSRWSYAISKIADEALGLAYHQEFGLPVTVMRFFNTVGPRQLGHYGMVIPRLTQQALLNNPLTVYGDGTQSRCFCDVSDTIRAITALVDSNESAGSIFNIGNTEEVSIMDLARRIIKVTGSKSEISLVPYAEAYPAGFDEMMRRVPDIDRIGNFVDWKPEKSLDEILVRVRDFLLNDRAMAPAT